MPQFVGDDGRLLTGLRSYCLMSWLFSFVSSPGYFPRPGRESCSRTSRLFPRAEASGSDQLGMKGYLCPESLRDRTCLFGVPRNSF
jgi:hypothetical protein